MASPVADGKGVLFKVYLKYLANLFHLFNKSTRKISCTVVVDGLLIPLVRGIALPGPFNGKKRGW